MRKKFGIAFLAVLLIVCFLPTAFAVSSQNDSSLATRINSWFGSLLAQVGGADQNQFGKATFTCGCQLPSGGLTLTKRGMSNVGCGSIDFSSACEGLCSGFGYKWNGGSKCAEIKEGDQAAYSAAAAGAPSYRLYSGSDAAVPAGSGNNSGSSANPTVSSLRGRFSCECWQDQVVGQNRIKVWKEKIAPVSCSKFGEVEACSELCPNNSWVGGFRCQDESVSVETESAEGTSYQAEYSCYCGKNGINLWESAKTACGNYASERAVDSTGVTDCPSLCASAGMDWISAAPGGKVGFTYALKTCRPTAANSGSNNGGSTAGGSTSGGSVQSSRRIWNQLSWMEKLRVIREIRSEKQFAPLTLKSSAAFDNGKVTVSWEAKNASECRVWLEGFSATGADQAVSGSLSFPVSQVSTPRRLRYNVRCFSDVEALYGKTGTGDGRAQGSYVVIPARRGGI
jgi:hypothetical protein